MVLAATEEADMDMEGMEEVEVVVVIAAVEEEGRNLELSLGTID